MMSRAQIKFDVLSVFIALTFVQIKQILKAHTVKQTNKQFITCLVAKYAHICEFARQRRGETIARCVHCLVCHLHQINEHSCAFVATND